MSVAKVKKLVVFLFVAFYIILPMIYERLDKSLKIFVLDVWQGDAILIRTPSKKFILVDTGMDDFVLSKVGKFMPFWVKKIDFLIITHPHYDHIGGAIELMKRYDVANLIWFRIKYWNPEYSFLQQLAKTGNIKTMEIFAGDTLFIGEIALRCFYPFIDTSRHFTNINNASIAILMEFKGFKMWMAGDAEVEVENELISRVGSILPDVDVLKGGHHCSRTSNSSKFLEFIKPEHVICSCGTENKYGHPHLETLRNLEQVGAVVHRTDLVGTVIVNVRYNGKVVQYSIKSTNDPRLAPPR